ncbi:MAG: Tryptophan/tyrosine permease family protein [Parcubacteria group bacterium ADurb.Bin316]|nr:MAG: Tryptophan/tyrosine permease family protein [Parcubacteria group bacterium ADurb.Bin316]HOZ55806.1 aromatic amino acid transport family protein [bacterium]
MSLLNKSKNYYQAVAILIGQIVGVGIFSLPFLVAQSGVLSLLFLVVFIGVVQYFIQLVYANLVVATPTYHQLPGYAEKYVGPTGKNLVFLSSLVGLNCALLAYIIVSGIFLNQLLSPIFGGSEFIYSTIVFCIEAVIVFFGVHFLARVELIMTFLLILVVSVIGWRSADFIYFNNFTVLDWKYFLIPYGAMLFALDGIAVIPFVVEVLNRDKMAVRKAIKTGVLVSAIVTAVFALVIVGVTGRNVTEDALSGMKTVLHDGVISLALLFGSLCIFTSFIGSAQALRKIYNWDYKINKNLAWFFAVFVPYLLYIAGINNFIKVVSFAGAVAGGISSIVLVYIIMKNNSDISANTIFKHKIPAVILYALVAMFVVGIFYELFCFILK